MSESLDTAPGGGVKRLNRRFGGYGQARDLEPDRELTEVGAGTPGGEYLRRTWQPVCLSSEIGDLPLNVRMLGEDLVAFRTRAGETGLLAKHCSHRGASLEYGLPTEAGIRCCYHGWHFAVDGTILDTPNDPHSRIKEGLYHPAYPTCTYRGIVFAWMGPPDDMPAFPVLDAYVQVDTDMVPFSLHFPCNWVQVLDNTQDPIHTCFLHTRVSGAQFSISWGELPELEYIPTSIGMINLNVRRWNDKVWVRTTDVMLPNLNQTGPLWLSANDEENFLRPALTPWMRPIDDTHTQMIGWRYFNDRNDREGNGNREQVGYGTIDFIGQTEDERSYLERQAVPGDYEAIAGQGEVAISQGWNLNRGDRGVAMLRRLIRENIAAVRGGGDYTTLERAPQVDGVVPTFTQDTVMSVPTPHGEDRVMLREAGRQIWQAVLESTSRPEAQREGHVANRAREIVAAHRADSA